MRALNSAMESVRLAASKPRVAAALVLFAIVTALRFVFSDPGAPITFLFAFPIAMLAMEFGRKGGAAAALLGLALFGIWVVVEDVHLSVGAYLSRVLIFCGTGVGLGYYHQRLAREGNQRKRWFEMSNDMLCEANQDGYFTEVNGSWERVLGWTREELMGRPFIALVHPDDVEKTVAESAKLNRGNGESIDFANRYRAKDGSWRWLLWSSRSDGERIYAVAKDITDRQEKESEREEMLGRERAMARTDQLTGLPNRRAWDEELRRELERSKRSGHLVTVALLDLDRFKAFNDEHGHPAGDRLLREAADAWRLAIRITDVVARVGGEEFAVLLPHCPPDMAGDLVDRLRSVIPQSQSCSAGIAVWDGSETAEQLMERADAALYEAKEAGRDRMVMAEPPGHMSWYATEVGNLPPQR